MFLLSLFVFCGIENVFGFGYTVDESGSLVQITTPPSVDTGGDTSGGSSGGSLQDMENHASEAARVEIELRAIINEIEQRILDIETALSKIDNDSSDNNGNAKRFLLSEITKEKARLADNQAKLVQATADREQAVAALLDAYNQASAEYGNLGSAGDPVDISSGKYICDNEDYIAEDFGEKLIISRKLHNEGYSGSFGKNWNCSLDTRIIRLSQDSVKESVDGFNSVIETLESLFESIENYRETYKRSDAMKDQYNDLLQRKESYCFWRDYYAEIEKEINNIKEKNIYVAYGKYENTNFRKGEYFRLIYVDEDGREYSCLHDGDGNWIPQNPIAAKNFVIKDTEADGYEICYFAGNKKIYSSKGILETVIDRNGNRTEFKSKDGRIIEIKTKTGEVITIQRDSKKRIVKISGPVSGECIYQYSNGNLKSVRKNDGIQLVYFYDTEGDLTEIRKTDAASVKIAYEKLPEKVVSSVENGSLKEYFSYDLKNHKAIHTDFAGKKECFEWNSKGQIVKKENEYGINEEITNDENGLIKKINENGVEKKFLYNSDFKPISVSFSDGSAGYTEYDSRGNVIHQVDRDGLYNDYSYDKNGNLIESYYCGKLLNSMTYYKNGLLKTLTENGIYSRFEYNQYGKLIRREINYPATRFYSGYTTTELWEYDSNNRRIKYTDVFGNETVYSYGFVVNNVDGKIENFRTEQYSNGLKIIVYYDSRNREIRREETDTSSKNKVTKETVYGNNGEVCEVKIDGKTYIQYFYNLGNQLQKYYIWELKDKAVIQGILTEYVYESRNRKVAEIRSRVSKNQEDDSIQVMESINLEKIDYSEQAGNKEIFAARGNGSRHKYVYDSYGRLVKVIRPDGGYELRSYTNGGKIKRIEDHHNKVVEFSYNTNGSSSAKEYRDNNLLFTRDYDASGKMLRFVDANGNEIFFTYDSTGNLIEETGSTCSAKYEYDLVNRIICSRVYDNNGKLVDKKTLSYDDCNGEVLICFGDKYETWLKKDVWGRTIQEKKAGIETEYFYDSLGNCIKSKNGNGDFAVYDYDAMGNMISVKYSDTTENKYSYNLWNELETINQNGKDILNRNYDENGLLISESDIYGTMTCYNRDVTGNVIGQENSESSLISYYYDTADGKIITENFSGDLYTVVTNPIGLVTEETSFNGSKTRYEYDAVGHRTKKIKKDGTEINYLYLAAENREIINYSSGESFAVDKDPLNRITELKGPNSNFMFTYDLSGKLLEMKDINSNLKVEYKYDDYGRCSEKKSNSFDFVYSYDAVNQISRVEELVSGTYVELEYDSRGREIFRKYSNNVLVNTKYNSAGFIEAVVSREPYGLVISGEFMVYDENNRVVLRVDEKGLARKFNYDAAGRLESVDYPYDEVITMSCEEAENCGMAIKNDRPAGSVLGLSEKEKQFVEKLALSVGVKLSVDRNQYCFRESYEFADNGSIAVVKNPFGIIKYEYDRDNHLMSKSANSSSKGESYEWSKNGNLLSITNSTKRVLFTYGALDRPVTVVTENLITGDTETVLYEYDVLGRRISEIVQGGAASRFVYDGLSTNLLAVTPVFKNQTAATNYNSIEIMDHNSEKDIYRYIEVSSFSESADIRGNSNPSGNIINQKVYSVLNVNNAPAVYICKSQENNWNYNPEFVLLNGKNTSVMATTDSYASCVSAEKYDVWGNALNHQKEQGHQSFSCSDKKLNINYQIYDLGLRDYIPSMKCFSTEDPAKAGGNWYAYCSGDPVNYYDVCGLYKNGLSDAQKIAYAAGIFDFLNFDYDEYQAGDKSSSSYIPKSFDCADTAAWIDHHAAEAAGISDYSTMATNFKEQLDANNLKGAQNATSSSMYWDSYSVAENGQMSVDYDSSENVTKVLDGWNTDLIRRGTDQQKAVEKATRESAVEQLKNPDNVTPGMVIVWKKTSLSKRQNWTGHVGTIISRKFDSEGNILGFVFLQGHINGGRCEIGYFNLGKDLNPGLDKYSDYISDYMGDFLGIYEIQGNGGSVSCGN